MDDSKILQDMLEAAKLAQKNAYAPYSNFAVGAVVRSAEGILYAGCNVENSSYGLTLCAEGNALAQMVLKGDTRVESVLILSPNNTQCFPCGACRQRLVEFAPQKACKIYIATPSGIQASHELAALLPMAFGPHNFSH